MTFQLSCPQCGNTSDKHRDDLCEYRYYHDEIHEQFGWIASQIVDLIPGELVNEEKAIPVYSEDKEWDIEDVDDKAA
jgi:hypothetical protein